MDKKNKIPGEILGVSKEGEVKKETREIKFNLHNGMVVEALFDWWKPDNHLDLIEIKMVDKDGTLLNYINFRAIRKLRISAQDLEEAGVGVDNLELKTILAVKKAIIDYMKSLKDEIKEETTYLTD